MATAAIATGQTRVLCTSDPGSAAHDVIIKLKIRHFVLKEWQHWPEMTEIGPLICK